MRLYLVFAAVVLAVLGTSDLSWAQEEKGIDENTNPRCSSNLEF